MLDAYVKVGVFAANAYVEDPYVNDGNVDDAYVNVGYVAAAVVVSRYVVISVNSEPEAVDFTKPAIRFDTVVDPFDATENNLDPVEEATANTSCILPLVPCATSFAVGVEEPIPTSPPCFTTRYEVPELEATLNGSNAPAVPCMLKFTEEEVALIPATAPLSISMPLAVEDAPVALTTKPFVREPESLLLNVVQSVDVSNPLFAIEDDGKLRVRVCEVVEMLKSVPVVPVAMLFRARNVFVAYA